jgi:8-oxo-dGTP pyrophosphatase MutT (NUDIX family)
MIAALGMPKAALDQLLVEEPAGYGAAILFVDPIGDVLLLRRSSAEANWSGHWDLPGGKVEPGETPEDGAERECTEEIGSCPGGPKKLLDARLTPKGLIFQTFAKPVDRAFVPVLDAEHSGYAWAPLHQLPRPLHPGVNAMLRDRLGLVETLEPEQLDALRQAFAGWAREPLEAMPDPVPEPVMDAIALDRATVRRLDQDGHLYVELTPISKANVCPYYGREIPDAAQLGLDPDRIYKLYRHADELAKGAASFAGKPLLLIHTPISADDHPREVVVGSIGDGVIFDDPYLKAPLRVWDGEAIGLIESGEQKELSCGYRYRADMTPGKLGGEDYDGVMRDIMGNHVALVKEGRAGPDVVVGDSKPRMEIYMNKTTKLSRMAGVAHGAMIAFLQPRLAADAKIDLTPALAGVTVRNFKTSRAIILDGVTKATQGKLAKDAKLDGLDKVLVALDETCEAMDEDDEDDEEKKKKAAADAAEEEERKKAEDARRARDADPDDDEKKQKAMDAAIAAGIAAAVGPAVAAAVKIAKDEVRTDMLEAQKAIRIAEDDVRPYVGKLAQAFDSAEGIYRTALGAMGVKDADKLPAAALKPILMNLPVPGTGARPAATVAMDASGAAGFTKRFPTAQPVRTV